MTFRDKYKKDNEYIKPSEKTLMDLSKKLKDYDGYSMLPKNKVNYKLVFTAVVALLVFTVIAFDKGILNSAGSLVNKGTTIAEDGYYIPGIQIENSGSNALACRIATLVYKGRVYTIGNSNLTIEEGKELMGEKLGVTWDLSSHIEDDGTSAGYIDLESLDDFATFGGGEEVYNVKGYDDNFRLITYSNNEYGEYLSLWECLNDMTLKEGSDLFGQMNIKGNLSGLKWDAFNNWNNGTLNPKELLVDETVNSFIEAIYKSTPASLENEEFNDMFFYDEEQYLAEGESKQKFMYLKLNDGTSIELRLFKNGYIFYSGLNGFVFKVDDTAFNNMWSALK